jgi:hypothetical protein
MFMKCIILTFLLKSVNPFVFLWLSDENRWTSHKDLGTFMVISGHDWFLWCTQTSFPLRYKLKTEKKKCWRSEKENGMDIVGCKSFARTFTFMPFPPRFLDSYYRLAYLNIPILMQYNGWSCYTVQTQPRRHCISPNMGITMIEPSKQQ